ncbi:DUF5694 domain-containing protein [Flavivirga rizhaonensis]|uniref:Uncharacterized protein n=1 Tax=Flavivirga rizhaonensis TaxID=2559571 RepID=A0A4S1E1C0_9FLAO|nr:DUF5694 domain-containing protein [Flavivirga rizhaonensis]TGV04367.1 hypothetical protein EM932_02270 [Flavivirga rizhaonensis]
MNKPLLAILFLLTISCQEKSSKIEPVNTTEIINPLADSDEFIGQHSSKVVILGVYHFNNPGLDDYKQKYRVDILSDERQQELNELLEKLEKYKPTKILIEASRVKWDSIFNIDYSNYINDNFDIKNKRNEFYQIGFKLAKKLDHEKIYCVDEKSKWFGADIDWENYNSDEYQKSLGQFEKANRYNYENIYSTADSLKVKQSLIEHFLMINNPKNRLKDHQAYLTNTVLTGAGDLYIGADNLTRWYQRNIKIFANAYDIVDFSKEDRLLLIYGAGHVWQLRQFFKDSPDFEYVEVNDYLAD